jgi:hypothetical protein
VTILQKPTKGILGGYLVIVYHQDSNFGTILRLGTLPANVCPTQTCNHSARNCHIGVENIAALNLAYGSSK